MGSGQMAVLEVRETAYCQLPATCSVEFEAEEG